MAPSRSLWLSGAAGLRARAAAALVTLLVFAMGGCGEPERAAAPPAEPRLIHDLIERFSAAEILQPTTLIDFNDPASLDRLLSGWSVSPQPDGSEKPPPVFSGETAELEFYVDPVSDLAVAMRCALLDAVRSRQLLSLEVNGSAWREIDLVPGMRKYQLKLPAELLRQGQNRLRIVHRSAGDGDAGGEERGRVRWLWIRFQPKPVPTPAQPLVRADRQAVFIPYGTRIDYYLELPQNSVLRINRLRQRRDADGRLRILWHPTEGEERIVAEPSSGQLELPIAADSRATGRLSLVAVGDGAAGSSSAGVMVFQPAIWTLAEPAPSAEAVVAERPGGAPPNVVLYLIDTLRADHLGCYGYEKGTSPRIDGFAETAVLFENAQAQSPWTRSSVASIMTGLLPQIHRANDDEDALADEIMTLAEMLRAAGYRTVAVTGNGNAAANVGFAQGFDIFDHRPKRPGGQLARSSELNERAFPFLEKQGAERPFFLFVHTIDPHAPYDPPEPFRSRFAASVDDPELGSVERLVVLNRGREEVSDQLINDLRALYDAEIAANDDSFGALVDRLREQGLYDNSLIILLSDHGEEFYDHGSWTHGQTLHAEMLDTPLIIKLPGMTAGGRTAEIVQHVDVVPTIAELVGFDLPQRVHGKSLLPLLRGKTPPGWSDRAVAYLDLRGRVFTSLIDGSWKIIQRQRSGRDAFPELYDRSRDRGERNNLASERPEVARLLVSIRKAEEAAAGDPFEPPQLDISAKLKMREELRALGYLR